MLLIVDNKQTKDCMTCCVKAIAHCVCAHMGLTKWLVLKELWWNRREEKNLLKTAGLISSLSSESSLYQN